MEYTQEIEKFVSKCRKANLHVTPQRMLIFKELISRADHPDAETIYRRVKEEFPTISLATVYNTLDTFANMGLITQFHSTTGTARYDTNTSHHHHLVCVMCDTVIDIESSHLNNINIESLPVEGFHLLDHRIEMKGVCNTCQKEKPQTKQ